MNQQERRRLARFRAGLILEAALNEGWRPPDLVTKYGEEEVDKLSEEILSISTRLIKNS